MIYVYLFYGATFLVGGSILSLQLRAPFATVPRSALVWLAAFAFAHGAAEWIFMGLLIEPAGARAEWRGLAVAVTMIALSFGLLLNFGAELWIKLTRKPRWTRLVPAALAVLVTAATACLSFMDEGSMRRMVEVFVRYGLGVGASLVSAYGLVLTRRASLKTATPRSLRLLTGASVAFVAYAVLAGLVVPEESFFPASRLNTSSFLALTGLRIEIFRALCAITLAWILSELFVVEASRAEWMQLREDFISVVAHDLRSPVSSIDLIVEMMEMQLASAPEGVRASLGKIRANGRRLERMIADLLDASRIKARQLNLVLKPTDLRALVPEVLERSATLYAGHPVRTQLPDQLALVRADPDRVEQIFTNLLSNAGKYAHEGTEIAVGVTPAPDHVEVAVSNAGPALDPEVSERIFTRFYRATGAAQRAPGLGVGLYITKGLVEAHRGRIWVESGGGQVTFRFTLPVENGASPRAPSG